MRSTALLAEFATQAEFGQLDSEEQSYLKLLVADTIGACIHGSKMLVSDLVYRYAQETYGEGNAQLLGRSGTLSASGAALVNGTQAHSFELDDYHPEAKLHPGAVVIPAALAVAPKVDPTGWDFLSAVLAGYEVMIRVSLAAGSHSARRRGWHLTGMIGPLGAAAATGRLLGLTDSQMKNSLGIAASFGGGVFAFSREGAMTKRLHPGKAASGGVASALLAKKGFTGPTQVLDEDDGGLLAAISDASDPSVALRDLGTAFESVKTAIKPYACCASNHSSIDALFKLMRDEGLTAGEIESIVVLNSDLVAEQCFFEYTGKGGVLEAQMSLPYCVAVAALDGEVFTSQFEPERITRSDVRDMMTRIAFEPDADIDAIYPRAFPARLRVRTTTGVKLESYVEGPKGSQSDPYTWPDLKRKFSSITEDVLSSPQSETIVDLIRGLESQRSLDLLFHDVTPPYRGSS